MRNDELQAMQNLLSALTDAGKALEKLIMEKETMIDIEKCNDPEVYSEKDKAEHRHEFKAALSTFIDVMEDMRCEEDNWLDTSAIRERNDRKSEIFKTLAECFRPQLTY